MQLFATPLSHFSRKVRLLLDHYECDYKVVDVGNVADDDIAAFGGNPLLSVPVLQHDDAWMIDSDHIARYVTRELCPEDPYAVLTNDPGILNARAILNGLMAAEVKLILAERTGLETAQHRYFRKSATTISAGLAWLEERASLFSVERPTYLGFHLVCAWDHLEYYESTDLSYPQLQAVVAGLGARSLVAQTAPSRLKPRS